MADNIKIIGNIINTTTVQRYSSSDTNLITSQNLQERKSAGRRNRRADFPPRGRPEQ